MSKDNCHEGRSRRKLLKRLSGGSVGLGLSTGSVIAGSGKRTKESRRRRKAEPVTKKMTADPSTAGMSDRELDQFVDQMANKYGQKIADSITPNGSPSTDGSDVGTAGQMPGITPGTLVWTDDLQAESENPYGQTLVESDNLAQLYETDVHYDGDGDGDNDYRYYMFWLWTAGKSIDHINVTGDLEEMWSHINLKNAGQMEVYDPGGDTTGGGIPVTVSASVSGTDSSGSVGASAGIQGEFTLNEYTVGPHPEKTGQDTDEFAVRWKSGWTGYEGNQEINGTLVERRPIWDSRSFEWTVHLNGQGF